MTAPAPRMRFRVLAAARHVLRLRPVPLDALHDAEYRAAHFDEAHLLFDDAVFFTLAPHESAPGAVTT